MLFSVLVLNIRPLCLNSPPSLLTFTEKSASAVTRYCTPSSLILRIHCLGLSSFSHISSHLSSLLTTHLHPSLVSLSEMTHYTIQASFKMQTSHLTLSLICFFLTLLSPIVLSSHTNLLICPFLSVCPPSRTLPASTISVSPAFDSSH